MHLRCAECSKVDVVMLDRQCEAGVEGAQVQDAVQGYDGEALLHTVSQRQGRLPAGA